MKTCIFFLLAIVVLVISSPFALADGRYTWQQADADEYRLMLDGKWVGGYRVSDAAFYPRFGPFKWGEKSPLPPGVSAPVAVKSDHCPCCGEDCQCGQGKPCGKPSCPCVLDAGHVEADGTANYGIETDELNKAPRRTYRGREVTKKELLSIIQRGGKGNGTLVDDSKLLCLTILGDKATDATVLADLDRDPHLTPWKGRIKVQHYDASNWVPSHGGFAFPSIYIQTPDGKVLHRQEGYRGPELLAEALAKAQDLYEPNPAYRKEDDPDLNKPALPSLPGLDDLDKKLAALPNWAWLLIGGGVVFVVTRQEQRS